MHGRCGGAAAGTELDGAICLAASNCNASRGSLSFFLRASRGSLSVVPQHQHVLSHLLTRSIDRILFVIYLLVPKAAVCTWQGWRTAPGQHAVSPAGGFLWANSPCLLLQDSSDTGHGLAPLRDPILCESQTQLHARCSTVASETRPEAIGSIL